jgi:23S rRNA-/tRNA-specific pseudouridylate synthase
LSNDELKRQLDELEHHLINIAVGKRHRQKRKTLQKQCDRIRTHLVSDDNDRRVSTTLTCRNCGHADCTGSCWGFHGLKRKEILKQRQQESFEKDNTSAKSAPQRAGRFSSNQRVSKNVQRQRAIEEIEKLQLSLPPSKHLRIGVRVPPPCTRLLQTFVKGKWCGKPIIRVLREEFAELAKDEVFQPMLEQGLLRLNDEPLTSGTVFTKLKNMDVISRIVHWHEPPVETPRVIHVQKVDLPQAVIAEYAIESDAFVYVCDKPSSVPVHPAGPYLSNSLTMMVEGQETLETRSLLPCHRIDRVTSGLTICCTNVQIARIIQSKIDEGTARKLYLARVKVFILYSDLLYSLFWQSSSQLLLFHPFQLKGHFPHSEEEARCLPRATSFATWSWQDTYRCVEANAPVETVDPLNGIRIVSTRGKPSHSRFQLVAYDSASDTSLISCAPLTGRGHQLRVHLQWLGFPIDGDLSYGGQTVDGGCTDTAVERMMEVIPKVESSVLSLDSISGKDVIAAKAACRCCQDGEAGIFSSFTPAQLLYGSAICLHAFRYEIPVSRRKRKTVEDNKEPLAVLQMKVGLPKWAEPFESDGISWLQ